MFKNGLVAIIKANGKIIRDVDDGGSRVVYLPFGTDYTIALKNNESKRAAVSITVDGVDVLDGSQLVIDANAETEVKGFVNSSSRFAKNGFRFIEQTDKVKAHRGESISDGLVRVEFQYEAQQPERIPVPIPVPYPVPTPYPTFPYWWRKYAQDQWKLTNENDLLTRYNEHVRMFGEMRNASDIPDGFYSRQNKCGAKSNSLRREVETQDLGFACSVNQVNTSNDIGSLGILRSSGFDKNAVPNDRGVTVAGAHVNQQFERAYLGVLEKTKHTIVFELRGEKTTGAKVTEPLYSRAKIECPSCGTKSASSAKFCSDCSTALV